MLRLYEKIWSKLAIGFYRLIERNISIGKGTSARKGFYLRTTKDSYITIGTGCFFNRYFSANAYEGIYIGDNCIFGENVKMYDHNHKYRDKGKLIKNQGFTFSSINIGNNVWIGSNVVILKGVTIGDNSVIGAGCVIFKDVPSNCVVINSQAVNMKDIHFDAI